MMEDQACDWAADLPRRNALVARLIMTATKDAPTDEDAASALLRSAATVLARKIGEAEVCDLMIIALLETKAQINIKRRAH